eukprot:UC4_evm6s1043
MAASAVSPDFHECNMANIELKELAIVRKIYFGKYIKPHVCNLKEFKVYGGLEETSMIELFSGGLLNNTKAETFPLRHSSKNVIFPCRFIKIVPLLAHGPNFNYSIWHVRLLGVIETRHVLEHFDAFSARREKEVVRLCLKHFRHRDYLDCFQRLQKRTKVSLEAPILTELYGALVEKGDFKKSEKILSQAHREGAFKQYATTQDCNIKWSHVVSQTSSSSTPVQTDGSKMKIDEDTPVVPGTRSAQSMYFDTTARKIYLFGGWNGTNNLCDFWMFDLTDSRWTRISSDCNEDGGPSGRSNHEMCMDEDKGHIYILGKYIDDVSEEEDYCRSDFYRYDIKRCIWEKLSSDTRKDGGPSLLYDHQMCFDPKKQNLYVLGGRIDCYDSAMPSYSGLYIYNTVTAKWSLVWKDDCGEDMNGVFRISLRSQHSMLMDSKNRKMYIFSGQREICSGGPSMFNDFYVYSLDNNRIDKISSDTTAEGGPSLDINQIATIDCELQEIYVFVAQKRSTNNPYEDIIGESSRSNALWIYRIKQNVWYHAWESKFLDRDVVEACSTLEEPHPRVAQKMVYDCSKKIHYMFGGKDMSNTSNRFCDFWRLELERVDALITLQEAIFALRSYYYEELDVSNDYKERITYLRNNLKPIVNLSDAKQTKRLHKMAAAVFSRRARSINFFSCLSKFYNSSSKGNNKDRKEIREQRIALYENLLKLFPEEMKQPQQDLVELIAL